MYHADSNAGDTIIYFDSKEDYAGGKHKLIHRNKRKYLS